VKVRCDNCGTRYRVDAEKVGVGGRRARCLRCGQTFAVSLQGKADGPPDHALPPDDAEADATSFSPVTVSGDTPPQGACFIFEDKPAYEELTRLGQGGMATVTLAKDRQLLRQVAIKSMKPGTVSPGTMANFCREAQITAQLDHPHIVPLYMVKPPEREDDGISFVMKRVQGQTLAELIATARNCRQASPRSDLPESLALPARLTYFIKACEGLHFAHQKQVVHRDLKPSNIMVGEFGETYLMDWGIAGIIGSGEGAVEVTGMERFGSHLTTCDPVAATTSSEPAGTPGYMSPEQARGETPSDASGDVYAMGVVLFELVTLKPARTGSVAERMQMAREGLLTGPDAGGGEALPPALGAIIGRATAPHSDDRYPGVLSMAEDVQRFLRDEEVSVYPDNLARKCWRHLNRHRKMTAIALLILILLFSVITSWSLWKEQQAMTAGRIREKALTTLQAAVSSHAHAIDRRFLRMGVLAVNLAARAVHLMEAAPANDETIYTLSDFQDPWNIPEDLAHAPLYDKKISIDYPVAKAAPGIDEVGMARYMQRLAPLRHGFRQTLLGSAGATGPMTEDAIRHLIAVTGGPVRWVYLGLARGVMFSYPGKATYAADYDPRQRPWYKLGIGKKILQWGRPYADVQGQGLVLTCAVPLYGSDRRFLGVLGMDVTLNHIVETQLRRPGAVGVLESFLLDASGRIVARSTRIDTVTGALNPEKAMTEGLFPEPGVVAALRRNRSGLVAVTGETGAGFVVYDRLDALGWFYAEKLDGARLLQSFRPGPEE
jgi:eukaryotic-like serine/threonine-protein kinase